MNNTMKKEPLIFKEKMPTTKWWQDLLLKFLPTYVSVDDGFALSFKRWRGVTYFVGHEMLPSRKETQ